MFDNFASLQTLVEYELYVEDEVSFQHSSDDLFSLNHPLEDETWVEEQFMLVQKSMPKHRRRWPWEQRRLRLRPDPLCGAASAERIKPVHSPDEAVVETVVWNAEEFITGADQGIVTELPTCSHKQNASAVSKPLEHTGPPSVEQAFDKDSILISKFEHHSMGPFMNPNRTDTIPQPHTSNRADQSLQEAVGFKEKEAKEVAKPCARPWYAKIRLYR